MPHAQPPDTSETNNEESGTPVFFPPVGNFNAVVPLSEIDADSASQVTAPVPLPTAASPSVRVTAREREHDEQEENTLVPTRAARKTQALRPAAPRPSWPVMIMALALSLAAGLAAGVYLIKSGVPVEIHAPASIREDVTQDAAAAAETTDSQPTQVASESHPEARPKAETTLDADASAVDAEVRADKRSRDLSAPKRVTAAVAERTPERPARKAPPLTTNTPAPPEAVRARRATSAGASAPALRAPEHSLPVSSPPSSAKSKRVIQWP